MISESVQLGLFERSVPEKCKKCGRSESCHLTSEQRYGWDCWGDVDNKYYPEQQVLNRGVTLEGQEDTEDFETLAISACGSKWINARCENNLEHSFYIEMLCGKEYCPTCGVKGSKTHIKKVNKAMDRLSMVEAFGELVITISKEFSHLFLSREKLDSFYKAGMRIGKEIGKGGFSRVHFFGDKKDTMLEFHPHLNVVIVDAGYLKRERLEELKESLGRSFRSIIGQDVAVNMWYRYFAKKDGVWCDSGGRKCKGNLLRHKVKYITRPTIGYERLKLLDFGLKSEILGLLEGDKDSHKRLVLMRWFGIMSNAKYKKVIRELVGPGVFDGEGEKMVCPCCSGELKFTVIDGFLAPGKSDMLEVRPGVFVLKVNTGLLNSLKKKKEVKDEEKVFSGGFH